MRVPIRVTGARLSQNQLRLFVPLFQFLNNETWSEKAFNRPRTVRTPEQASREGRDEHIK